MNNVINLPSELWTLIFSFADGESVGKIVPQASKQLNKLCNNEELWKLKCRMKNMEFLGKTTSESWKQFYFTCKCRYSALNFK